MLRKLFAFTTSIVASCRMAGWCIESLEPVALVFFWCGRLSWLFFLSPKPSTDVRVPESFFRPLESVPAEVYDEKRSTFVEKNPCAPHASQHSALGTVAAAARY